MLGRPRYRSTDAMMSHALIVTPRFCVPAAARPSLFVITLALLLSPSLIGSAGAQSDPSASTAPQATTTGPEEAGILPSSPAPADRSPQDSHSVEAQPVDASAPAKCPGATGSLQRSANDPDSPHAPASSPPAQSPADVEELRRRIEVLAAEVEQLRSGEQEVDLTDDRRRALGLAPSAAATYRKKQGVSLAGYGDMLYERFDSKTQSGAGVSRSPELDFVRAILYAGYRFNDQFVFNSEIEVEHANEVSLEFAYLDYLVNDRLTLRGGMLLLPLGLINEFHEPNIFLGARRPETERRIIPSTWKENGFGILGTSGLFTYRAYVVSGLDAEGFSSQGLREGRQEGSRSKAENLAFAGRLDVAPAPGALLGAGLFTGGAGQGQFQTGGRSLAVRTTIGEVHGQVQMRGFDVRALFAGASVDDAAELNAVRGLTSGDAVAKGMHGGYFQAGYNIFSQYSARIALTPYYRLERINTQATLPAGFIADPSRDERFHTLGVELKPIRNIVLKTDYQWIRNEAGTGRNQANVSLGYAF